MSFSGLIEQIDDVETKLASGWNAVYVQPIRGFSAAARARGWQLEHCESTLQTRVERPQIEMPKGLECQV
ncbi:MAG: hypothetical protein WC989_00305 [Micavibrio sp.]